MKCRKITDRLIWLLAIILLTITFFILTAGIQFYSKMTAATNLVSNTESYSRSVSNSTGKVLIIGDSLAYGVGASSKDSSFAANIAELYPEKDIINKAETGSTTIELASTINQLVDQKYSTIFIMALAQINS